MFPSQDRYLIPRSNHERGSGSSRSRTITRTRWRSISTTSLRPIKTQSFSQLDRVIYWRKWIAIWPSPWVSLKKTPLCRFALSRKDTMDPKNGCNRILTPIYHSTKRLINLFAPFRNLRSNRTDFTHLPISPLVVYHLWKLPLKNRRVYQVGTVQPHSRILISNRLRWAVPSRVVK